jgi:hypothetical protein
MTRRGGEMNVSYDGNGRMTVRAVTGRMPAGSTEQCKTIKEGPLKRLASRVIR